MSNENIDSLKERIKSNKSKMKDLTNAKARKSTIGHSVKKGLRDSNKNITRKDAKTRVLRSYGKTNATKYFNLQRDSTSAKAKMYKIKSGDKFNKDKYKKILKKGIKREKFTIPTGYYSYTTFTPGDRAERISALG